MYCFITANAWCLEQHFELVELDGETGELSDEEEEASSEEKEAEKEKVAFARIVEALQAHPWSNLKHSESGIILYFANFGYEHK